jgi:hypothetical protein
VDHRPVDEGQRVAVGAHVEELLEGDQLLGGHGGAARGEQREPEHPLRPVEGVAHGEGPAEGVAHQHAGPVQAQVERVAQAEVEVAEVELGGRVAEAMGREVGGHHPPRRPAQLLQQRAVVSSRRGEAVKQHHRGERPLAAGLDEVDAPVGGLDVPPPPAPDAEVEERGVLGEGGHLTGGVAVRGSRRQWSTVTSIHRVGGLGVP